MNKIKLYWSIISPFIKMILVGSSIFFAIGLVLSIPLCLLWNWLMPYIFGLPTITILQAFGLSALITLLSPKDLKFTKKNNIEPMPDIDLNNKLSKALDDIEVEFHK